MDTYQTGSSYCKRRYLLTIAILCLAMLLAACQANEPVAINNEPPDTRGAGAGNSDTQSTPAVAASEPLRVESEGEVPFYARIGENETFGDGDWNVVVFYRPPDCIPPDFNLNQFFHFPDENSPGAFACGPATTTGVEFWENGPETDPAPLEATTTGRGAVPVWFVAAADMQSAMSDGVLTIGELAELPSRMVGTATTYDEFLRPGQTNPAPVVQFTAKGTLEDGAPFAVDVSQGAADVEDHVDIEIGE